MKQLCLVLIGIVLGFQAAGQFINLELESYDSKDGLSQNHVFAIVQDRQGFIWIGTDDGLNRFDGHEFKVYKHDDEQPNSIIDNSIRALMADDSSVWIGTNEGLCRYYPSTEAVYHFPFHPHDPQKLHGLQVNTINRHPSGNVWIGYLGEGLDVVVAGKPEIVHYSESLQGARHLRSNLVSAVRFLPDGNAIVGTLHGLDFIDATGAVLADDEALKRYPWRDDIEKSVKSICLSSDKRTLWIGAELRGLFKVDLVTGKVENFNADNVGRKDFNSVIAIHEDFNGNVWIGGEVIFLFDHVQNKPVPYHEYGIHGTTEIVNPIYSIFEDKDHNMWLGTYRIGVLKSNPAANGIIHYYSSRGSKSIRNEIFCFSQDDDGEILVGTGETGLFSLRKDLRGFKPVPLSDRFPTKSIKTLFKDASGYLWIGSWDGGLTRYHPKQLTLVNYHPDKGNFPSRHVWDICGDSKGNMWIGTLRDGILYYDPRTGKTKHYRNVPGDSTSLINDDVMALLLDSRGRLWVATGNGLSVLTPGKETFINFTKSKTRPGLTTNLIFCLYEDRQGRVWVGTNGGGITVFSPDLKPVYVLNEKSGMPSNTICALLPDDRHFIWASTYNGLAKINPASMVVEAVPQVAGLKIKEFIPRAAFKSADGKLFFGSYNGFDLFHPDSLTLNPIHERVVFTSLKIQNQEVMAGAGSILERSITETEAVRLSYKDHPITISFAPLTYNWQRSLRYAYLMEGVDDEWQHTTADRRFVHYTNLAPGSYTLNVRASFDGIHWPEHPAQLRIEISPPWWGTTWFRTGVFVLVALVLFSAYKVRVGFLKRQKRKLEQMVRQGTREIQALLKEVASKNEELEHINEELKAQRDTLAQRSNQLETARARLENINASLEELVDKRTKKLNLTLRELETFLYRASHDLRGPISSMLGLIRVAAMESTKDPINKTYTDFLHKTTIKLERTLQKLTQKYTIQKSKINHEPISRDHLIRLVEETTRNLPSFRPADFDLRIQENLDFAMDKNMLNILMTNLLENAFYFSERAANKKVMMEVSQSDQDTVITVLDYGPGINADVREKIFTMFYRGHELSTGNGLGLYLVKSALKKVKGKIALETEEGCYARFVVTLPRYPVKV